MEDIVVPNLLNRLLPWEFSPAFLVASVLAGTLFVSGIRQRGGGGISHAGWRSAAFFSGMALVYAVMQTRLDYLAQHMFWIHRAQHLVLHHIAPCLICLAAPREIMALGMPRRVHVAVMPFWSHPAVRVAYHLIQQPVVASALFVGLIAYWLMPSVHFITMLDDRLYWLMNWSMLLDGLLFWSMILDSRSVRTGARAGFGARILVLWLVMPPQIIVGAWIALARGDIYTVYAVCGRIWPIDPLTDQHIGGLITWIPGCMMSVIGGLILLPRWARECEERRRPVVELLQTPSTAKRSTAFP